MLFHPLQRRFRARRMALLARTLGINRDTRVLDVGGTIDIWRVAPVMPRLVLLNSQRARYEIGAAEAIVLGDGTSLPFADRSFDLVFSNSVIEHVGGYAQRQRFADGNSHCPAHSGTRPAVFAWKPARPGTVAGRDFGVYCGLFHWPAVRLSAGK